MPTKKQIEQIKRVCGENYEQSDIPAIWRRNEIISEEELVDMFGEGGAEEIKEFYQEDEKYDYHPRPEEVE